MSIRRRHHNILRSPRQLSDEAFARSRGSVSTTTRPGPANSGETLTEAVHPLVAASRSQVDEAFYAKLT